MRPSVRPYVRPSVQKLHCACVSVCAACELNTEQCLCASGCTLGLNSGECACASECAGQPVCNPQAQLCANARARVNEQLDGQPVGSNWCNVESEGSSRCNARAQVNVQPGKCACSSECAVRWATRGLYYVQCACANEWATRCATRGLKLVQCACANGCATRYAIRGLKPVQRACAKGCETRGLILWEAAFRGGKIAWQT